MQLDIAIPKVERSHEFQESFFQLGDLSLVMSILRSKLYSDPIKACCQEILSNARDAHREVGSAETPVEVFLPTELSPRLVIKDYGPGISPNRMEDIYLKYGASSKRSDNTQTGGFGLGAKTPFAYGDSFVIETIHRDSTGQNVKSIYTAFIDETNIGKVSLLLREITDLPTGTEIQIPIRSKDFDAFKRCVCNLVTFWKVRPIFHPETPVELSGNIEKIEFRDGVGCYTNLNEQFPRILLDEIPYHFDWFDEQKLIELGFSDMDLKILKFYKKAKVILSFETGDISVSATREKIELTDKNLAFIHRTILNYDLKYVKKYSERIAKLQTLEEANAFLMEFFNNHPKWMRDRLAMKDFEFKRGVTSNVLDLNSFTTKLKCMYHLYGNIKPQINSYLNLETSKIKELFKNSMRYTESKIPFETMQKNISILIDDVKVGLYSRLKEFLKAWVLDKNREHDLKFNSDSSKPRVEYPDSYVFSAYLFRQSHSADRDMLRDIFSEPGKDPLSSFLMSDPLFKITLLSEVPLPSKKSNISATPKTKVSELDLLSPNVTILYSTLNQVQLALYKEGKLDAVLAENTHIAAIFVKDRVVYRDSEFKLPWKYFKNSHYTSTISTDDLIYKSKDKVTYLLKDAGISSDKDHFIFLRVNSRGVKEIEGKVQSLYDLIQNMAEKFLQKESKSFSDPSVLTTYFYLKNGFGKGDTRLPETLSKILARVMENKFALGNFPKSFDFLKNTNFFNLGEYLKIHKIQKVISTISHCLSNIDFEKLFVKLFGEEKHLKVFNRKDFMWFERVSDYYFENMLNIGEFFQFLRYIENSVQKESFDLNPNY